MTDPIHAVFERAGYTVTPDAKGRYYRGMVRLLGGLEEAALLRDEPILRVFSNAQVRKGAAHTFKQLQGIANPRDSINHFTNTILRLADRDVFFRGYRLQCPECDLDAFYPLADAAEQVTCQGCRTQFQMPLSEPFAYQLNRLFAEGLKQGALTVLLAALALTGNCTGENSPWEAGLILARDGGEIDLDLAALCGGRLTLAECKDNFGEDTSALIAQIERGLALARVVGAARFVFATLRPRLPGSLADYLSTAAGSLPVEVLTRADLLSK